MAAMDSATPVTAADQMRTANDRVLKEELKRAAEKVDAEFSNIEAKLHRYPAIFRGLMSKDDRYFVPRCVTIGPYHHDAAPHLQRAEEMKRVAAYSICEASGHSAEAVYARILSVAGDARSCYDHDAVAGIPQADFATMMFQDACFLLQYIIHRTTNPARYSLRRWFVANQHSILRDIFLLENQVPWLVLDALMSFMPTHAVNVGAFISVAAKSFEAQFSILGDTYPLVLDGSYKPAHLLDLLYCSQTGSLSSDCDNVPSGDESRTLICYCFPMETTFVPQSSSAIDLAEMGIQLKTNRTGKFGDKGLEKGLFFGNLFLAPLVMDDFNACCLLNMAALETCSATRYTVTSYVRLIAMLMNCEEDVHELRVKRILHGDFSDQRTLSFVQDLLDISFTTREHTLLMADLEDYRRNRCMWISLHKFIYNNFKYIVMVFSVIGVLVVIFKALFSISMKQH